LTCHFLVCLLAVAGFLVAGFGLGVLGAEGVGDALVGGVGLTVDAVRVDLQQDRDAVPGPAGDLGRGAQRGAALRLGQGVLPCFRGFSCRIDGLHELDIEVGSNAVYECGDLVEEAVLVR
jgi:hypothetical protein